MTDREAFEAWAREQCYEVDCRKPDGRYWSSHTHICWEAWQAAIQHERSECAKVCAELAEALERRPSSEYVGGKMDGADECAAAIRARN